jgi:copper transport protein
LGSVRVVAADGHRVDLDRVYHPGGASSRVAVGLRSGLAAGSYLVLWRVVSADSHPVAGSFTFSLGHVGPVAAGAAGSSGRSVAVVLGTDRFVGYAGLVTLLGGMVFLLVCWPAGWSLTRARALLWCGLALQGAADVGAGLSQVTDPAPARALLSTRFGPAHLARLGLLLAIAVTLWASRGRRLGRLLSGFAAGGVGRSGGHGGGGGACRCGGLADGPPAAGRGACRGSWGVAGRAGDAHGRGAAGGSTLGPGARAVPVEFERP